MQRAAASVYSLERELLKTIFSGAKNFMMRVKTFLAVSPIEGAGIGLFAGERIKKGDILWEFDPFFDREFTEEDLAKAEHPIMRSFLKTYCFKFNNKYFFCADNGRFFNHSDNPNCYSADFTFDHVGKTRAKRDIEIGEELTDDYAGFGYLESDRVFNMDFGP